MKDGRNYFIKRKAQADPQLAGALARQRGEFTARAFAVEAGVDYAKALRFLNKQVYKVAIERVRHGVFWRHPLRQAHPMTAAPKDSASQETVNAAVSAGAATCWAVIAYRWGWLNNSHYIVRLTTDLQAARDAADAEAMHRGGKYGVTVWDSEGNSVYHSPSAYGEKAAHTNWRIELFESVGLHVVVALEDGKPLTTEEITKRWQDEKRTQESMERACQPNV